jgi:hypothetical protein
MDPLTSSELVALIERGELSASVWVRRHTLLALTEMAAKVKGAHDPLSRWRLKRFRAVLDTMEGNDEIMVTGGTLCETVLLASSALSRR